MNLLRLHALFRLVYRKVFAPVLAPAPGEKPRALAAALRALDLQVCPHTKTGAHLDEHRFELHVMWNLGPRTRARTCCVQRDRVRTCAYAKRSTPSLETRAKNSGSSSGALSPKVRASRKMRSPSSRRLSSPVRSVAMTSPFST